MIGRWISMDKEKGSELFRQIIDKLKDEIQIPAEFRNKQIKDIWQQKHENPLHSKIVEKDSVFHPVPFQQIYLLFPFLLV